MRTFSARETEWLKELDGLELADFWPRAIAFCLDWIFIWLAVSVFAILVTLSVLGVRHLEGKPMPDFTHYRSSLADGKNGPLDEKKINDAGEKFADSETQHVIADIALPVLYFGILCWKGKGQTPGKRMMKIRVVSIAHRHLSFWHSVERALGYGAAALELGFGFIQFFIHPYRRCAQDRLAETIVITERSYVANQHKFRHPLVPDGQA